VSGFEEDTGVTRRDRSPARRYGIALLLSLGAIAVSLVLLELSDSPIYAPLVAVIAVVASYSGLGPALFSVVVCWLLALVLLVDSDGMGTTDEMTRWSVNLAVAVAVGWVTVLLRRGRERAASAVLTVEESVREMAGLQRLATSLSAAITPSDVAHALIAGTPRLVGARGGALGLIDGDSLEIVDPRGAGGQTHQPGARLPLGARAPIAVAARVGEPVVVRDRATFERLYPDGAALTLYACGALAVPLRVAGDVVGSMSLLYEDDEAIRDDAESIATLAAGLGGQALERARLYQRESESRRALDRILRVAPRFHADSIEAAALAICREARTTFGADVVTLWRRRERKLVLVHNDPAIEPLEPGLEAELEDFPALRDAVGSLEISFVPDLQLEARGVGLERVGRLDIHSSLRSPIAIGGGDADLVLIVSWQRVVAEPDPSTLALVRRFTDQAGLALEQVERRRAEAEAARRADETRRLQEITAALAVASTAADVSNTCLEHALSAVGAEAGFVVLSRPDAVVVDLVASNGYADDELAHWGTFALDSDAPFARAIASGEPIWALTADEMAGFAPPFDEVDRGWASLPLKTSAGVRGALHLSFRQPRELDDEERRWLQAVVSQCAQALERSRLFDAELLLRERSEQLQAMTASLSNALTRTDVANVLVDATVEAVSADGAALVTFVEERRLVSTLASRGYEDDPAPWLEVSIDTSAPATQALKRRVPAFYGSVEDLQSEFPNAADEIAASGHSSFLFVPLVAGRRANALLVVSWEEQFSLQPEERRFVESLAGQAAQALDRATSFETEQTIAETLQRSVLPVSLPHVEGIQLAARYLPGTAELDVGGDWFDAIPIADGRLGLVVGDVVGKGVHAAATMAQLRNALRAFSLDRMKPSSTMARLNRLAKEVVDTAFATIVYVVIDPVAQVCRFTSAGHPPPLAAFPDGRVEFLEGGRGLPLGVGPDTSYSQAVVELPAGTALLLYTDGLVERRDRPIDEGLEALRRAAAEGSKDPEQLVEHVLERMIGDDERGDDIAMLAVRILVVAPRPLHLRVPSDVGSLDLVRDALRTWLSGTALSRADAHDVVLATWEACANAIEHATDEDGALVEVRAELAGSGVRIAVEDTGRWTPPTERDGRGLGLQLMRSTMSSVEITPSEAGTRVIFEKAPDGAGEPSAPRTAR
jgi:serine phosphatase RsbU (regulator of sigma subunit)/anti-sigma regulatory factor (Ser/Thr protein kinase)